MLHFSPTPKYIEKFGSLPSEAAHVDSPSGSERGTITDPVNITRCSAATATSSTVMFAQRLPRLPASAKQRSTGPFQ